MKSSRWHWQLDEMFLRINGERHYLWRAVDHGGEVLESFVTKTCDIIPVLFRHYTPSPAEAEFDGLTAGLGTIQLWP
jgi:hypothetical protein